MSIRLHRRRTLLLLVIILVAFAVRVYHIDHFSFWIDEALTSLRVKQNLGDIIAGRTFIQDAISQDTHPPLYYIIVYVTRRLWGESDFAYRYPSLLFSVLLVPVLYQLGRRLFNERVGLLAAAFTAVNPLQVWYAQEARMYTLLVLLGALSSYILWRALESSQKDSRSLIRWGGLYLLMAGLTLYTHYTAVFLLAGHGLLWMWLLWRSGYKKLILIGAAVAVVAIIPLLPFTIPRLFTGAESGFTYINPTVMLGDVVRGFTMGVTAPQPGWFSNALWWLYAILLIWSFVAVWQTANGRLKVAFLLIYLFFTVIGLAAGSLIKPMYQGVRHTMLGSPALYLLLAAAVVLPLRTVLGRGTQFAAALLVALGFCASLYTLYTDPQIAKDDLRAIVAYIERQAGTNDVVVYNDTILMLAHWHYQTRPDLPITALPVYPHVFRPETVYQLETLVSQYQRLWFVPPIPTDHRDDGRAVRQWVRGSLPKLDEFSFTARSAELKVELYNTKPFEGPQASAIATPHAQWAGLPTLQTLSIDEQTAHKLWLTIGWQGELAAGDKRLIFTLRGADDWIWLEENRPFWRSDHDWAAAELTYLSYGLDLPDGLPPGRYELRAQGWDQDNGRALGELVTLSEVEIAPQTAAQPAAEGITFANGVQLLSARPLGIIVRPGHQVPIMTLWQGGGDVGRWQYDLQIFHDDQLVFERSDKPGAAWLAQWPAQALVGGHITIRVPDDAAGGTYELRWRLREDGEPLAARAGWWPFGREWQTLGSFAVDPWPFVTKVPPLTHPVEAQFGSEITLLGYELEQQDNKLDITLVWRVDNTPIPNSKIFIHLVDEASGEIVSQVDGVPVQGQRLTPGWRTGEIIVDPYTLDFTNVPSGIYRLNVGIYNAADFIRPAVTVNGVEQPGQQLFLQEVTR